MVKPNAMVAKKNNYLISIYCSNEVFHLVRGLYKISLKSYMAPWK